MKFCINSTVPYSALWTDHCCYPHQLETVRFGADYASTEKLCPLHVRYQYQSYLLKSAQHQLDWQ